MEDENQEYQFNTQYIAEVTNMGRLVIHLTESFFERRQLPEFLRVEGVVPCDGELSFYVCV